MLAEKANALIAADHPIISAFSDEASERRYWEIEGFGREACGGTHLKRTGEVGAIKLKRDNIGKGKERIEITFA
jgi:Ser-tRNA(Ala) deacylase AlaX